MNNQQGAYAQIELLKQLSNLNAIAFICNKPFKDVELVYNCFGQLMFANYYFEENKNA